MTTNSTAEIQEVHKAVQTLATHVLTLAKRVYAKDDDQMPYIDDDDEKDSSHMSKRGNMHKEGHDDEDEDVKMTKRGHRNKASHEDEEDSSHMSKRGHRNKAGDDDYVEDHDEMKTRKRSKGFADSAEDAKDEEDSKFGDAPDPDIDGNEGLDPAAAPKSPPFSGDRDDETFNVSAMMKQITDLTAMVEKMSGSGAQTIVKSMVPGGADRHDGREVGEGMVVTREMQVEAKGRSYQELNRLREELGDLPRHGFLS